ncbi:MAG TPA: sigma-70 family RNA polymerase sigma factor [Tepidisphaeraceae bacterium]|jgi:RNA polymerase sigma-70 factor (ECF subfamily)|nr:sigma-70 family RNA polymerase sigma factor [Tepidisphaeraceae bacterium]
MTLQLATDIVGAAALNAAADPRGGGVGSSARKVEQPIDSASLSMTDEALLSRLQSGESDAGDALVQRYFQPLLRYLRRLAGDDMAEELLQQTWLSVLDHMDKFDSASGTGGFKAWLFRIATNKANDHWRSRGREKAAKEGIRLIGAEWEKPAGTAMEAGEDAERLREAIAQLPESQRQVLYLRYYSDMKFVEIAEMLGCPLNTALGRVHKAMIKLRSLLDPNAKA